MSPERLQVKIILMLSAAAKKRKLKADLLVFPEYLEILVGFSFRNGISGRHVPIAWHKEREMLRIWKW